MAKRIRDDERQRLGALLEEHAGSFRGASEQIERVAETLTAKKYVTQRAWLVAIADELRGHAEDLTRQIRLLDPEILGLLARLGIRRGVLAGVALASIVGTGALEEFGASFVHDFGRAESAVSHVTTRSTSLTIEVNNVVVESQSRDVELTGALGEEPEAEDEYHREHVLPQLLTDIQRETIAREFIANNPDRFEPDIPEVLDRLNDDAKRGLVEEWVREHPEWGPTVGGDRGARGRAGTGAARRDPLDPIYDVPTRRGTAPRPATGMSVGDFIDRSTRPADFASPGVSDSDSDS